MSQAVSPTATLAQHVRLRPLYGDRLTLDYERPASEELNAHFASCNLTGPYWSI